MNKMKKLKVLNLYSGIGGNRKLWQNVDVTAVERNKEIAMIYNDFFPQDKIVVGNAHKYLINNYYKYDFIWSSPPCPSHSRMRTLKNNCEECKKLYPNMMLYEEIIFLKHFFKGKWVVENVISYYDPLIKPFESENHYFWSNFFISKRNKINRNIRGHGDNTIKVKWDFNISKYNIKNKFKNKILNNLVNPYLGLHILKSAYKIKQKKLDILD